MWVWRALLTVEQKCREQILKVTEGLLKHILQCQVGLYNPQCQARIIKHCAFNVKDMGLIPIQTKCKR